MNLGVTELLIILGIIILLFGAKKIPELASGLGRGFKSFKRAISDRDDKDEIELTDSEVGKKRIEPPLKSDVRSESSKEK